MNLMYQISLFISELLILIDNGESISISKLEDAADNKLVFELIENTYEFKNIESTSDNLNLVKDLLNNVFYISEQDAKDVLIQTNGLVYLVRKLTDKLTSEGHDYIWNSEDN